MNHSIEINGGTAYIAKIDYLSSFDTSTFINFGNTSAYTAYISNVQFIHDIYISNGAAVTLCSAGAYNYYSNTPDGTSWHSNGDHGYQPSIAIASGGTVTLENTVIYSVNISSGGTLIYSGYNQSTYAVNVNSQQGAVIIDNRT